jgi:hypothetical protein
VLNVDTIPNATYEWFKKTGPNDSISIGAGTMYNIPYLLPSDTGMYVAKASVNNGCLTQVSYFHVVDYCGMILPTNVQLTGKNVNGSNQLTWVADNENDTREYIVERSASKDGDYKQIASVAAKKQGHHMYFYTDNQSQNVTAFYRIRVVSHNNKSTITNTVAFKGASSTSLSVYPNPVKDVMNISIRNKQAETLRLSIINAAGQTIHEATHQNVSNTTLQYRRPATAKPGVYVLKINNLKSGEITSHKVMFE